MSATTIAARTASPPRVAGGPGSLRGALRYEWVRLRTVRSTWWLAAAALAVHSLIAFAVARSVVEGDRTLDREAVRTLLTGGSGVSALSVTALFAGVLGVLALGQEYRHGTIRTTLTALPRRGTVLAAKAAVLGLFAAVLALAAGACAYAVAWVALGDDWTPSLLTEGQGMTRALAGFVALVALTALLGLALAGAARHVAAALVVLIALPVVLEPAVRSGLEREAAAGFAQAGEYLPFTAASRMLALTDDAGAFAVPLTPLAGGLVFLTFVAVVGAAAAVLFKLRDA